ncbi:MAG: hydantoinase/carbamoylase family amidase [Erysipelotrichaceae bacterium]|jgi:allantoate deiminase
MSTNLKRIINDLEKLATFTATPNQGVTRVSYSKEDKLAKQFLIDKAKKMKLHYYEDGYGTLFIRKEGKIKDAPVVMHGSHYDTVYNGGAFDGAAGIIASLEVMRVLVEEKFENDYPIEMIIMNAEEGGIFGPSTGVSNSRAIVGTMTEWELDNTRNKYGLTKREAMKQYGLEVNLEKAKRDPDTIKNFVELHIEQGSILDRKNKDIGIIEYLAGIGRYWIRFTGVGADSTMKMSKRRNALLAASDFTVRFDEIITEMGEDITGMVGQMKIIPNSSQFVPEFVEGKIEIRTFSKEIAYKYDFNKIILDLLNNVGDKYGVDTSFEEIRRINYPNPTSPSIMNQENVEILKEICNELGYSYLIMNNGTGHDSMIMTDFVDTNMIYVPSKNDGVSHCPEELTDYQDIKKGADVLLNFIKRISVK